MKKKLIALLCALLMLTGLAACGQRQQPDFVPKAAATPEPAETIEPNVTEEPFAGADEIVIVPDPGPYTEADELPAEQDPENTPRPGGAPVLIPTETPVPTQEPEMTEIDVRTLPQSLYEFLATFDYGYTDRAYGREYDCMNCVDVRANIVAQIVNSVSCVDFSLYPGEQPVYHWEDGTVDPQNYVSLTGSWAEFDPEQIRWIAEAIFHVGGSDYLDILDRCLFSGVFYEDRNAEGEDRYFMSLKGSPQSSSFVRLEYARSNGSRYELVYNYLNYPNYYLATYYAELQLREIDGREYWTMTRHTAALPSYEAKPVPELFSMLTDVFYLSGGLGEWYTELYIFPDGSFTGRYQDIDFEATETYDEMICYSNFEGRFGNPMKVGPYTYSVDLLELHYLDTTEDIIMVDEDGWRTLNRSTEAVGLAIGRSFQIYLPGSPYYRLPESFRAWYSNSMYVDQYTQELPSWGMLNLTEGYGFCSYSDEP